MPLVASGGPRSSHLAAQEPTEVVALGGSPSPILVAESYRPAVLRAYFDRVAPDAVCLGRGPEELARGSHYEFTYEIQGAAEPLDSTRRRGV